MFSNLKTGVGISIFILIAALLSSCQLPLNEAPPEVQKPEAGLGDGTRCLNNFMPVMKQFIDGNARPDEIRATWDCFGSAISLFQKSTRGSYVDRFTDKELRNFFENYFLAKDAKINDRLLTEIFRIKQLLVGGNIGYVTRDEMNKLILFSRKMGEISVQLVPYMKVFSFNWKPSGFRQLEDDVKYFEKANLEIQSAAKELGAIIAANGLGYEIQNIVVLFEEVAALSGETWPWIEDIREMMPLIQKLKGTLTGGDDGFISHIEWRRVSLLGARGFVQYLRYHYFIEKSSGVGSGTEMVYIARTIDDLFSFLGDMVGEKPEGVLTKSELLDVFARLTAIFPDFVVSEKLLDEFMKIKRLFFGGSLDNWKKIDFDNARSKVDAFRTLTEKFLAYWVVYSLDWDPKELDFEEGQSYLGLAEANISEFGRRLGLIMETDYNLNDILGFAEEWGRLYPGEDPEAEPIKNVVAKFLPLAVNLKNIVLSDEHSTVEKNKWSEFLQASAEVYGRYLNYHYFVSRTENSMQGEGLRAVDRFVVGTLGLLDKVIQRKPANPMSIISFVELDRVLESATRAQLLPKEVTVGTLKQVMRVIFQKMLIAPERRLMPTPPQGIGLDSTRYIRQEYGLWSGNQVHIQNLFVNNEDDGLSKDDLQTRLAGLPENDGVKEMKMMLDTPVVLSFDPLDRVFLFKIQPNYNRKSMNYANLARALVRLIIRSYAMDLARIRDYSGVSEEEVVRLFAEVKPLVVELGLMHPNEENFPKSRFRDANLFTPRANGNTLMDFKEGTDLALMIWSGLKADGLLFPKLDESCRIDKSQKLKSDWTLPITCVLDVYRRETEPAMNNMPEFIQFKNTLNRTEFDRVMVNLLKAAGYIPVPSGLAKVGDISLYPHVTQYVETVMQRFDADRDGYMETYEALRAYPVYENILKQVSKDLKDRKMLQGAFTWFLKHGRPPETIVEKIRFLVWCNRDRDSWNVRANRERFAQILGYIGDSLAEANFTGGLDESDKPEDRGENSLKDVPDSELKPLCDRRANRGSVLRIPEKIRKECARRNLLR
jgi:hypothetical protein